MYKKRKRSWAKHLDFTIIDLLAAELAIFLAVAIRFPGEFLFFTKFEFDELYINLAGMLIFIDLVSVFFTEAYSGILSRSKYQEASATFVHTIINWGGSLVYMYMSQNSFYYSRSLQAIFIGLMFVFSYFGRVMWKRQIRKRKLLDKNKSIMMVIADSASVEMCLSEIAHNKFTDFAVSSVAIIDDNRVGQKIQGFDIVASGDDYLDYVRNNVIDEAYIDMQSRDQAEQIASLLVEQGVTVHVTLLYTAHAMPNRMLENYGNYMVLTTSMHIANNKQMVIKRLVDIIGGLVGLLFTGIFFIIFAIPIRVQSKGSVFFKQTRIGRNGRRFKIYKFRSMYVDAEERKAALMEQNEMQGNMFKMDNDPRITKVGRIIRKYSIDEFPQFWNVLKGDMSLVGTRPPTEDEFENYAYHHKARLGIKPGLTGMWQVSGRNKVTDFEKVVELDTEYISKWSLGLDMKILFKTVAVVLTARGAK